MLHALRYIPMMVPLMMGSAILYNCAPSYPASYPEYNWAAEDAYWRNQYVNEPYYTPGYAYGIYQPAYLYGAEVYHRYPNRRFEELNEQELRAGWEQSHGRDSRLSWEQAREATHASYAHLGQHSGGRDRRFEDHG